MERSIKIIISIASILFFSSSSLSAAEYTKPNIVIGSYGNKNGISYPLVALSNDKGKTWHYPKEIAAQCGEVSTLGPRVSCNNDFCILEKNCDDKLLIATSVDQGNSWIDQEIKPSESVKSFYARPACNNQFCAFAGDYHRNSDNKNIPIIGVSKDKGVSWAYPSISNLPKEAHDLSIGNLTCTDESCVAIGAYDYDFPFVVTSIDQGVTWSYVEVPHPASMGSFLFLVHCEGKTCLAMGYSHHDSIGTKPYIITSTNAGVSWSISTVLFEFPHELNGMTCNGDLCATIGDYYIYDPTRFSKQIPFIGISQNEGALWFAPLLPPLTEDAQLNDVSCMEKRCIAVGSFYDRDTLTNKALLTISRDNGMTWSYQKDFPPPANPFSSEIIESSFEYIHCAQNTCVVSGRYADKTKSLPWMLLSQDGGETWISPSTVISALPTDFASGSFLSGDLGTKSLFKKGSLHQDYYQKHSLRKFDNEF